MRQPGDIDIVIQRKEDDPKCARVSIGGNDDIGYYVVYRLEALAPGEQRALSDVDSVLRVFERCHAAMKAEAARLAKPPMKCKRCQSEANNQVLTPDGPHYGKLVCASCGNFLTWLGRPVLPINPAKLPKRDEGDPLPQMTGRSPAQIALGEGCRNMMMRKLKDRLAKNLYDAMLTIRDATFWIANKDRSAEQIRWPHEWS